jgi:uncharacterized protein YndB with AHSA1/START domain
LSKRKRKPIDDFTSYARNRSKKWKPGWKPVAVFGMKGSTAWTTPKHLPQWWGPKQFTTTVQEIDVRPGGVWRYVMHGPDRTDYDNKITFIEIEHPERLEYTHGDGVEDEHFRVSVTFDQQDETTQYGNGARDYRNLGSSRRASAISSVTEDVRQHKLLDVI